MASRKLQVEIDRCLKKIQEGLGEFRELFEKTVSTTNASQKEKMEQELKKEIKKLQRLRDQIKTWLTSSEIKDKTSLLEHRRLIELEMERFKVLEREIKTKQFSKEGLQAKEKLDPHEVAKAESGQWISNTVDKISTQMDAFEAEMEAIKLAKGKRKDTARLAELNNHLERHKFHISKLETMLRMLENDALSVDDVETVKDSVEYYVDSNQEPDFLEDEEMYDHLDLIEDDIGVLEEHHATDSPEPPADEKEKTSSRRASSKEEETSPAKASKGKPPKAVPAKAAPGLPPPQPLPAPKPVVQSQKLASASTPVVTAVKGAKEAPKVVPAEVKPVEPVVATKPELSFSRVVASKLPAQQTASAPSTPSVIPASLPAPAPPVTVSQPPQPQPVAVPVPTPPSTHEDETMSMKSFVSSTRPWSLSRFPTQFTDLVSSLQAAKMKSYGKGDEILRNQHLLQILESSFQQCPDLIDGERPQPFLPTKPVRTPPYYPQKPFLAFDMPTVFEKLDLDTLFFIFYYQQGTRQQYLAARELKRQSWRFHKKYLTWFQRHEEPKAITEEYEQGTYIYFDYEGAWCQRKKSEFTFEYRFLEDE